MLLSLPWMTIFAAALAGAGSVAVADAGAATPMSAAAITQGIHMR
jgi:hypothetical protein